MSEPIPPYQAGGQPPYPPPPYYYQRPPERRSKWWIPVVIIGGVIGLFIVGLVVVFMAIGSAIGSSLEEEPIKVEKHSVLYLQASGMMEETRPQAGLASVFSSARVPVNLVNTLTAIKRAKDDSNIMGIYFEGKLSAGFAKSTELRDALVDFKKSGKFIYAFLETGDESSYYLASVADSIFMPTEGLLEMNGYAVVAPFFKEALNKIGVDFYVQQFEEYKSAGESFSRTGFSEPARRELMEIMKQRYTTFTESVAKSRNISVDDLRNAMNRGVYTTDTLMALHLIDGIKSHMETKEWIRKQINAERKDTLETLRLVSLKRYVNSPAFASDEEVDEDKQIAIVFGSGSIVSGKNQGGPFGGESQIASESFIKELRKARDNKKVKAIIIRIDSPGGSVIASDAIWSEIREARKIKPVYASMSDVAASGGYYMAMACDTIIAHPQTVTGSIGVILMIPNLTGALNKLGVSVDTIKTSESAAFLNPMLPFSDAEKAKLYALSEQIYRRFVSRVAESRGKTFEQTREVAKGRVWTGAQAREVGLVDVLGGLQASIDIAKKRIGVSPDKKVAIRFYPEQRSPVEDFIAMLTDNSDEEAELGTSVQKALQPGVEQLPAWNLLPDQMKTQVRYMLQLNQMAAKEHALMAMPVLVDMR